MTGPQQPHDITLRPDLSRQHRAPNAGQHRQQFPSGSRSPRAGIAAGGIKLLVLVGKKLLPRVLDAVAGVGSQELMLIVSAAIALLAAVFTSAIGLSA